MPLAYTILDSAYLELDLPEEEIFHQTYSKCPIRSSAITIFWSPWEFEFKGKQGKIETSTLDEYLTRDGVSFIQPVPEGVGLTCKVFTVLSFGTSCHLVLILNRYDIHTFSWMKV